MLALVLPIGSLLIGVALLLLGGGLLNTLLALRGGMEGFSDGTMGFVMSGYFIGFFVGIYLALPLIRRIGHIRAFALCAAVMSCSALLHILIVDPWAWLAFRVLTGAVLVILYTLIESWLNGQTPAAQRGRVFATYMAVNLGSLALAQQLLQFGTPDSFVLFAVAAMLISISLVPVTWTRMQQPEVHEVSRMKLRGLWKIAPISVAAAFLSGLAMGAFWGLTAVYGGRLGLDSAQVATMISLAILGGAAFQYPLGRLSDSFDRRRIILGIGAAAIVVSLIMPFFGAYVYGLWVTLFIYGGLAFAVYPVAVAYLIDHLEPNQILAGGSGLLLLHGIGAAIGPALAGQLMTYTSPQALPIYFAGSWLVMVAFTARNLLTSKDEHSDHPAPFVPMVRTTPTALEMLPEDQSEESVEVSEQPQ